jgi:uncharacterized protein YecE (DUF72 family)
LQDAQADEPTGYPAKALDRWAGIGREWATGGRPADLAYVADGVADPAARDVFIFFINGAKERAPAAAQALIARLGTS